MPARAVYPSPRLLSDNPSKGSNPQHLFCILLISLCLLLVFTAKAQTLTIGVGTTTSGVDEMTSAFGIRLYLGNLRLDSTRLDLHLASDRQNLSFALTMRETESFGPLGNISLLAELAASTSGHYDISFGLDGVIASVAAALGISIFSSNPAFDWSGRFQGNSRPILPVTSWGLATDISLSYRVNRDLIVSVQPSLYFAAGEGLAGRLGAELRLLRIIDDGELLIKTLAYLPPGLASGFLAAGTEYRLSQRNTPRVAVALWLAASSSGLGPGISMEVSQSLREPGFSYRLNARLEPYRTDIQPLRLELATTQELGFGQLIAELYLDASISELMKNSAGLSLAYRFELP